MCLPDRNIAAARSASVLVTVHGSGSNNLMLMEPGSALVEVRPLQFGTHLHEWANAFLPKVISAHRLSPWPASCLTPSGLWSM